MIVDGSIELMYKTTTLSSIQLKTNVHPSLRHTQAPPLSFTVRRKSTALWRNNLVAAGKESLNDLVEVLVLEVGEENGIISLRDGVAGVELASNGSGESHAGGGNASDKEV